MNTLATNPVVTILETLHREAAISDRELMETMMARLNAPETSADQVMADLFAKEKADYRSVYHDYAGNFLAVSPRYGQFLYMMARPCKARRIVEFGTSMGISTIYLAAALRDNSGGQLISSEMEHTKVTRARASLDAAGLADLVDIREGDALETLRSIEEPVDFLLLDGAFSLYLPVLKLIEPWLAPGAVIFGENAFDPDYLAYLDNPINGYLSQMLPLDEGRGNGFAVRVG
ncbi:O-methyltransferase [Komagataeibacter diospyri]|uniref:Putative O-methyltransferase n=1 Tax=Komagataeibacter diospyri TaxID=1932662 RepID=A0A4P5NW14_9PROT|nr:class I SAM-dependent methyltransferase [Komagataeibacter diospyri]GCE84567.1 putative O-methyltransferase [Komagataeibacter diospyri]